MKKTEFQKYAYTELSKTFLELFNQGKIEKYSLEAKGSRQKIKYEPAYQRFVAVYFYRTGKIVIYQAGDFGQRAEDVYYEWQDSSDLEDVVATLVKDMTEFVRRINGPLTTEDDFSEYWGHDGFCEFGYDISQFKNTSSSTE